MVLQYWNVDYKYLAVTTNIIDFDKYDHAHNLDTKIMFGLSYQTWQQNNVTEMYEDA